MVGSSNRSASPLTSRSIPNLPRSLQPHKSQQQISKSFNGTNNFSRPSNVTNPRKFTSITPANSPAELGARNNVAGEEKENEKGQFLISASKLRSPSNKSKNFMAPTISAAIKCTPSPRKKILVERNDPVRTSITLSDGKATFFSSSFDENNDVYFEEKSNEADVPLAAQEVPIVHKALKKVTFKEVKCDTESFIEKVPIFSDSVELSNISVSCPAHEPISSILSSPKFDVVKMDFEGSDIKQLKDSCICEMSENLPLSEDNIDHSSLELSSISLSCPPHEPNSNILSSPKIDGVNMDFEGSDSDEIKHLEDSCMCELSENVPYSESLGQSQTVDSRERLEDVSESLPLSTPIGDAITEDSGVPKQAMKPHFLRKWKCVCLVLVLLGSYMLSVINFPTMGSFVPKDSNFELPELSEVSEIAKVNLGEFGGKVKQWSADYVTYLYKMVLPLLEVDRMGPFQFMNLTVLEDDYHISSFFDVNSRGNGLQLQEDEMEEVDAMKKDEHETEEVEDEMEEIEDEMEEVGDALKEDECETEEVEYEMEGVEDETKEAEEIDSSFDPTVHIVSAPEAPDTEFKMDHSEDDQVLSETEKLHVEKETVSFVATTKLQNQQNLLGMVSIPESPDTAHLKKVDASEIDYSGSATETEMLLEEYHSCSSVESGELEADQETFSDVVYKHESSQIPQGSESSSGESRIQANIVLLGISLALLGLGTVAVIVYLKLSKRVSTYVDTNPISNKIEFKQEVPSKENVVGESCASEMSSSHRSSSSYQRKRDTTKSESYVYSGEYSFGSPSYGSFTTYEPIPIKHAGGDEEIVTPVRRSSRLRKQVTSQ